MFRSTSGDNSPQMRLSLVLAALDAQLKTINKKRYRAQKRSAALIVLQLIALALTPGVLALSEIEHFSWYTLGALVLSAVSVFTGGLLASFSMRDRWMNYVRVSGRLQTLKLDGELLRSRDGKLTDPQVQEFRYKFEEALSSGNEAWQKAVSEAKPPEAQKA